MQEAELFFVKDAVKGVYLLQWEPPSHLEGAEGLSFLLGEQRRKQVNRKSQSPCRGCCQYSLLGLRELPLLGIGVST